MSEEGRYVIRAFEEGAWSVVDKTTLQVYALELTRLNNLIVHVFLVELLPTIKSRRFLSYSREILSARLEVSSWAVALQVIDLALNRLVDGEDVENPVDLAILLGADLHGQPIGIPNREDS